MAVKAARGETTFVKVPLLGAVDLPSGPHLLWFAGVAALAPSTSWTGRSLRS